MAKKIELRLGNLRARAYAGNLSDIPEMEALQNLFRDGESRNNVVTVRLSDHAVQQLDLLVEATLFSSRSEAAAFLIGSGIEMQKELLEKLSAHAAEIKRLKEQLRNIAVDALKAPGSAGS